MDRRLGPARRRMRGAERAYADCPPYLCNAARGKGRNRATDSGSLSSPDRPSAFVYPPL
jgi:hypothetical protein